MTPESIQMIVSGGAAAVLFWLVYQFLSGNILSRHSHNEIVTPLKDTIKELNVEVKEIAAESAQTVKDLMDTQRKTLAEQGETIRALQEAMRREMAHHQADRSGTESGGS
jgi:chaperonin cofactor prefoldin